MGILDPPVKPVVDRHNLDPDAHAALIEFALGAVLNVVEFGAVGDGSDASAAVLAAIATVPAPNPIALYFPGRRADGVAGPATYGLALGAIGSAVAGQGRAVRMIGDGPYNSKIQPASAAAPIATIQGSSDSTSDFFELDEIGIHIPASRAYDVPVFDIVLVKGMIHVSESVRVTVASNVTGTVFRLDGSYEGKLHAAVRSGRHVVPYEIVNVAVQPSSGSPPQMDTIEVSGTVSGSLGIIIRGGGNEIHGIRFDRFKVYNGTAYPTLPTVQTTLDAAHPASAGDLTVTLANATGLAPNDCILLDASNVAELCKIATVVGNVVTLSQPLVYAHPSNTRSVPVLHGGAGIVAGNVHAIALDNCHLEKLQVGLVLTNVQGVVVKNTTNATGQFISAQGNTQQVDVLSIYSQGTDDEHTIIGLGFSKNAIASAASTTDAGQWWIRGITVASGAAIQVPNTVDNNTKNWIRERTSSGQMVRTRNSSLGSAKCDIGWVGGTEKWSLTYGGTLTIQDIVLGTVPLLDLLPWRVDIDPFMSPLASVGSWTLTPSSADVYGATLVSAAQGDSLDFQVVLVAGTWNVEIMHASAADSGIATVQLDDGAGAFATVGTIDTYSGSPARNVRSSVTGIVVASTVKRTMRVLANSKNVASAGFVLSVQRFAWRRTA